MDFDFTPTQIEWRDRVRNFIDQNIKPQQKRYHEEARQCPHNGWQPVPLVEELKEKAKAEGLWNMFMPPSDHDSEAFHGAGLNNLDYAPVAEQLGHVGWASEVFNCSAPDTGNMEILQRYATPEQKQRWLRPLMDGEIRSSFLMTEPLDGYLKSAACTLKFDSPYTACWRGYLGTWSIREGRLYLVELEGWTRPEFAVIEVSLQDLFPNHTDGVFADWFSGELRCANGELATYVHLGYASRYKQELFIEIRKGVVVGERIEVNDIAVPE